MRYKGVKIGKVPGIRSMENSTVRIGGKPGKSFGKTSENSRTSKGSYSRYTINGRQGR